MRHAGYWVLAYMTAISVSWLNRWVMLACLAVIIAITYRSLSKDGDSPFRRVHPGSAARAVGIQILLVIFVYCAIAAIMGCVIYAAEYRASSVKYVLDRLNKLFAAFDRDAVSFVNIVIFTPIAEELFFRGYFLRRFRAMGSGFAIGFTSAVFASLHMIGVNQIFALLSGILWGRLAVRYGSLLPSLAAHIFTNCAAFLILLSQLDMTAVMTGLARIYGGSIFLAPLIASGCSLWLFIRMSRRVGAELPSETAIVLEPRKTVRVMLHWPLSLILFFGIAGLAMALLLAVSLPVWWAAFVLWR
jgi:membrane protease YdiL (CAAX protease family)